VRVEGDEIQVTWLGDGPESGGASAAAASTRTAARGSSAPAPTPQSEPAAPPAPSGTASPAPSGAAAPPPADGAAPMTAAPSQQEFAVRAALESVMDPEINLSVIDLGLIREIHFLPDHTHIKMMLTTPFCPYAAELMEDVKRTTMTVVALPCEVEILPDAWSPELMPDPGLLGFSF